MDQDSEFDTKFTLGVVSRHPCTPTAEQFLDDFSKCFDSLHKKILKTIIFWETLISIWKLKKIFFFQCAF